MVEGRHEGGFLIHCDETGAIAEIVHDGTGCVGPELLGRPFTTLVAPGGLSKALDFYSRIRRLGAQYGWEMPTAIKGVPTLVFMGVRCRGGVTVAASVSPDGLDHLVVELMRLGNEQANAVRSLMAASTHGSRVDEVSLDDFSRLNSEFATMQRELARKNAELAQAIERKNMMLGMAAHDLRSPLSVVSGFAEHLESLLADRLKPNEASALKYIRMATGLMAGIVTSCLDFSAVESGKLVLERVSSDLGSFVREGAVLNGVIAEPHGVGLEVLAEEGLTVSIDRNKMMQVINNLIGNAVKFSPDGSAVVVTVKRDGADAVIAVADQGPGIPEAEHGKLFLPFSCTSVQPPSGKGTGLGLAIAKAIVEGHGGHISAESAPGRGSVFTVRLPI